ncbi:ABC transporter permease [Streptococcus sp. HF-2466]|uniref:ABC transporter permease n=1 Tax=Streptococcus sp. HF-2466 TaxID=2785792 RepID=UPI00189F3BAB|nr:ABC transporter permease [Streptococcus sp. HF-2466]MBF7050979.1 ABC transporter permease [Streptococcus sp. HF-2466]
MKKLFKLIKLELKRNNIKTYVIASSVTFIVMLGFIYLFAYAPQINPDPDLQIFAGYPKIISLFSTLSMAVFATLSATMCTRFIIDEYKDKRAILLFSYPIRRDKILCSKLMVAFLFTLMAMVSCNVLAFGIFGITESISPLVEGTWTVSLMMRAIKITIIMSMIAASTGIIAVGIGFLKKSIPTTILSAVFLSSLFCNILFSFIGNSNKNDVAALILMCLTVLGGIGVSLLLTKKINHMEVE